MANELQIGQTPRHAAERGGQQRRKHEDARPQARQAHDAPAASMPGASRLDALGGQPRGAGHELTGHSRTWSGAGMVSPS